MSGAEQLPASEAPRASHPVDAIDAFFAEHGGAGLKLPTGWFGRPYDNQHRLTRVEQMSDALVIELDDRLRLSFSGDVAVDPVGRDLRLTGFSLLVWDWREYGSDTPHRETFHDGGVDLVAPIGSTGDA